MIGNADFRKINHNDGTNADWFYDTKYLRNLQQVRFRYEDIHSIEEYGFAGGHVFTYFFNVYLRMVMQNVFTKRQLDPVNWGKLSYPCYTYWIKLLLQLALIAPQNSTKISPPRLLLPYIHTVELKFMKKSWLIAKNMLIISRNLPCKKTLNSGPYVSKCSL